MAPWRLFTLLRAWCIVCAASSASWRLVTGVGAWCVVCAVSLAPWRLFTGVRSRYVLCAVSVASWRLFTSPPHGGLLIGGPENGAPPPSKSSLYAIIYNPRAEMKHIPKVYDAATLNDRLRELIRAVIFVSINHGCFAKLGPLQGFNFFTGIH